ILAVVTGALRQGNLVVHQSEWVASAADARAQVTRATRCAARMVPDVPPVICRTTPTPLLNASIAAAGLAAQPPQPRARRKVDESLEIDARRRQPAGELRDRPAHDAARGVVDLDAAGVQEALDEQLLLLGSDLA